MQGATISWVGQSFALPKCSASGENKPRIRRTKDERRKMVTTFIKKYQSSNSGKFPSLNLTHKEVGGSFYTIREIVRDIIQENKVLGPGNPSSKLLNLEHYSEEVSFLNIQSNASISAVVNGIDQAHHEVASSMEEQKISSDENIVMVKPVSPALCNTQLNEYSSWQLLQNEPSIQEKFSVGIILHEEVAKMGTEETNIHMLTEMKDDSFRGDHQINDKVQLSIPKDRCIQYIKQSIPLYPTSSGNSFIETELKNQDKHNKIHAIRCFSEEGTDISGTTFSDSLPVTNMFFSEVVGDQSNCLLKHHMGEVFPLVADNLGQDSSSKTPILAVSNTSKISRSGHEVHLTSEPFEEGPVINSSGIEPTGLNNNKNIFVTLESSNISNEGIIPFIPFEKEQPTSGSETWELASLIERADAADGRIVDKLLLQTISPCPCATTEIDIHLMDNSRSSVDTIKESENASSKLPLPIPIIQGAGHAEFNAGKQSIVLDTTNGSDFVSSSYGKAVKEPEITQTNPVWAAIKSFVSCFVKYWSR